MSVSGKISGDPDKTISGTEKIAAAAGGVNYGIVLNTIAAWLALKTQTLIGKTIDAASNTISNITLAMFAAASPMPTARWRPTPILGSRPKRRSRPISTRWRRGLTRSRP